MNSTEYINAVINKDYPEDRFVPLDIPFEDDKGLIQNLLLDATIRSISVITSKHGSIRSNHYHKTDWHYLYIVSGSLRYYERDINGSNKIIKVFKAGEMFFTPPMKVHKVEFLENTIMMSFAKNIRDHKQHEEDLIREEF
jgi:dTDP-4-dehydrorhamnose 3,5-epimerase-like enzyme